MKGLTNIATLPIVTDENNWEQREYYRLYSRITKVNDDWLVVKPEDISFGTKLSVWLRS